MKTLIPYRLLCVSLMLLAAGRTTAQEPTPAAIYEQTVRSSALVFNDKGWGTGWLLVRPRGLLLTNHHVVKNKKVVGVVFPTYEDGRLVAERSTYLESARPVRGRVALSDPKRDLALVELDTARIPATARSLPLAAAEPSPGERVHSVGNPDASDALWIYTEGTVRQVYRKQLRYSSGQQVDARVVETQSPINPGDSGGPMVNDRGELVGVNAATKNGSQLISSAIALSEVQTFAAFYFNNQGAELYQKGEYDKAIAEYDRALNLRPAYARAMYNRGLARAVLGQRAQARRDLEAAVELDPQFARLLSRFLQDR